VFTYYSSVYSGDVAIGLGGMAFNEIILQCYVLDPVLDSSSNTLTKTEMHTDKQILPLLTPPTPAPAPVTPGASSAQQESVSVSPSASSTRPTTSRPSVRATLLVKQLQQQAIRSPSFVKEHGLEGYSSYQSSPQRAPPLSRASSLGNGNGNGDGEGEKEETNDEEEDTSDVELDKFEIDSDLEEGEGEEEEQGGESEEECEEEPLETEGTAAADAVQEASRPVTGTAVGKRRVRKQHLGRGNVNGSVSRAEVDMVFVSACVSG
jgi:hypothetical protein